MIEGIRLEHGEYGCCAVITSAWPGKMTKYMLDNGIVAFELNDGKGWIEEDLSFGAELPQLRALKIIDITPIAGIFCQFIGRDICRRRID